MATVRAGDRGALLVIDAQVGVMREAWDADRIVGNVARAVERAREAGAPVIWVQHHDEELVLNTPEWELVPELVPADGDPRVFKEFNSSFERTSLEQDLEALGVSRVALAGAATNWCVRATAHAALERGYDVVLVADGHTTTGESAAAVVDDLNEVLQWVTYADVSSSVATAEELDFAAFR